MTRIETLIEQTSFLLAKQKEASQECKTIFDGLLTVVQTKLDSFNNDEEDVASLEHIYKLVKNQADEIAESSAADVEFLTEQLDALEKVKAIKEPEKAREILSMIIDENEELRETSEFKKEIMEEAEASKRNLLTMVADLKEAIQDGNAKEVALYLESVMESEDGSECCDDENCEDDDCCDDDLDGESGCCNDEEGDGCGCGNNKMGGCSDCKGCGTGGGCGSKNVDIFADLKKYEQELEDKKSTKH